MYVFIKKEVKEFVPINTEAKLFSDYNEAYSYLRNYIKEYALKDKSIFNDGHIKVIKEYYDKYDKDDIIMNRFIKSFQKMIEYLKEIILNNNVNLSNFNGEDWAFTWKNKDDIFELEPTNECLSNGICFQVETNINKKGENKYYLHINDSFEDNDQHELYIDLVEAE